MRALITGIGGQDGSYLAEQLVAAGWDVHGVERRPREELVNLAAVAARVTVHRTNLVDIAAVCELLSAVAPDRIFHLAARSFIGAREEAGMAENAAVALGLLEAAVLRAPKARVLFAGSAAQLAGATTSPQDEDTASRPLTVYGLGKQLAAEAVTFFRTHKGLYACTAILYNHESPRRPPQFISRKLASAAARIARGLERSIAVGDLDAVRDWGFAPEYTEAMARMLELDAPEDLVLATGVPHTVRDMADAAFSAAGLRAEDHIVVESSLVREREPLALVGNPARARARLGWEARVGLAEIMRRMVAAERTALDGSQR